MKGCRQISDVSSAKSRCLLGGLVAVGAQSRRETSCWYDELSPPELESSSDVVAARTSNRSRQDDRHLRVAGPSGGKLVIGTSHNSEFLHREVRGREGGLSVHKCLFPWAEYRTQRQLITCHWPTVPVRNLLQTPKPTSQIITISVLPHSLRVVWGCFERPLLIDILFQDPVVIRSLAEPFRQTCRTSWRKQRKRTWLVGIQHQIHNPGRLPPSLRVGRTSPVFTHLFHQLTCNCPSQLAHTYTSHLSQLAFEDAIGHFASHLTKDNGKIEISRSQAKIQDIQALVQDSLAQYSDARRFPRAKKWLTRVLSKIHHYGNIMDVFVQHHPEYVALVWGAMKVLLVVRAQKPFLVIDWGNNHSN